MIVSRALTDFGEALAVPQASAGRGRVIVDRRATDAGPTGRVGHDRRRASSTVTEAALRVLGFAVVRGQRPARGKGAKKPIGR